MPWLVSPLRGDNDCTLNGVTSPTRKDEFRWFLLLDEKEPVPANVTPDTCLLRLERRLNGTYPTAYPIKIDADGTPRTVRGMAGGNFVWTSDSRFRSQVCEFPIPVHDRVE